MFPSLALGSLSDADALRLRFFVSFRSPFQVLASVFPLSLHFTLVSPPPTTFINGPWPFFFAWPVSLYSGVFRIRVPFRPTISVCVGCFCLFLPSEELRFRSFRRLTGSSLAPLPSLVWPFSSRRRIFELVKQQPCLCFLSCPLLRRPLAHWRG